MSDREIRALEREIHAGSVEAIIRLDKVLRRQGLAADYYFERIRQQFWQLFDLDNFFETFVGGWRSFNVYLPDCFGILPDSFRIRVELRQSEGIGWYPAVSMSAGFHIPDIAEAMFGEDIFREKIFTDFWLKEEHSFSLKSLEELYNVWVQKSQKPYTFHSYHYGIVDLHLREAFDDVWEEAQDRCARVRELMPYII